ncbi:hypothetical protein SKAU_G00100890 [Synaphobranchus kaupii]|uniref:Uncharacterized protein n=1 Tax=Synaphobranchus kaupii TaxID=118154 RepID=A0A9Q1FYI9_SYNKA|nr:hypothetical protein SKAU_G00100890 [Synaphobranchus kaupii]
MLNAALKPGSDNMLFLNFEETLRIAKQEAKNGCSSRGQCTHGQDAQERGVESLLTVFPGPHRKWSGNIARGPSGAGSQRGGESGSGVSAPCRSLLTVLLHRDDLLEQECPVPNTTTFRRQESCGNKYSMFSPLKARTGTGLLDRSRGRTVPVPPLSQHLSRRERQQSLVMRFLYTKNKQPPTSSLRVPQPTQHFCCSDTPTLTLSTMLPDASA